MRNHMKLSIFAVMCISLCMFLKPSDVEAKKVKVSANWTITNTTEDTFNDFHLILGQLSQPITPTDFVVDDDLPQFRIGDAGRGCCELTSGGCEDGVREEDCSGTWFEGFDCESTIEKCVPKRFTWWGGNVNPGGSIHVGLEFEQECENEMPLMAALWTKDGDPKKLVRLGGFKVGPLRSQSLTYTATYYIQNLTDEAFKVNDLRFKINAEYVPLDDLIPYTLPGFGDPVPDFFLYPNESWEATFTEIEEGTFLLAQGRFISLDQIDTSLFIQEHEHYTCPPIPTLTEWGLIIFGVVLLGFITYVFLRRRKTVVSLR